MDGKGKDTRKRSRSSSSGSTRSRSSSNGSRSSGNKKTKRILTVNELLMNACYHGNVEAASKLLLKGANINYVDGFHYTPLLIAAESGNKALVELLVKNGAIVDGKEPDSVRRNPISTPITLADKEKHPGIVSLLQSKGAVLHDTEPVIVKEELLPKIDTTPTEEVFLALMRFIASKKQKNVNEALRIIRKIKNKEPYVLKSKNYDVTIENAGVININQIDRRRGDTPLGNAVLANKPEIVKKLIELGANVNMKDGDGWVPLKIAYSEGFMDIYELLRSHGAHYPMDPPR